MAEIPRALLDAYRNALYVARVRGRRMELKVGAACPQLDAVLEALVGRPGTWAMITAYNPRSKQAPVLVNRNAHRRLKRALQRIVPNVWPGFSEDPGGEWPREPMWVAVGIPKQDALALGREFEQYAIVFGEVGATPRLLACLDGADVTSDRKK